MNAAEVWWQALADGPVLMALFDAEDRLRLANAAFRAAWALGPQDAPTRAEMIDAARAAGVGPVEPADRRRGPAAGGQEQAWRDGRRYWWVDQATADGGCVCTGVDVSGLRGTRAPTGELLTAQAGLELLQSLLSDAAAWPLCVATTAPGADPLTLLARIRGEDSCARLDDGRLLLMLPATAPAQAAAMVQRLGGLALTEAQWGESAMELLLRA